jgi:hypothetical protein
VQVAWVDASPDGSGQSRITDGAIPALLTGMQKVALTMHPTIAAAVGGARGLARRYFGRGDVVRNATIEFGAGAEVEIDSVFEGCALKLGAGTSLVIGPAGVLSDCQISGDGEITIHGSFFERESPGIVGPRALVVTAQGALVALVEQAAAGTRFAFEKGCQLRLRVSRPDASTTK